MTVIASEGADGEATADSIMEGGVQRGGPPQKQGDGRPPAEQDSTDQRGTPPTR